jgi:hypothetical protein
MRINRISLVLLLTAALLLAAASASLAEDEDTFLIGDVSVGTAYTDLIGNPTLVAEYISLRDANRFNPVLGLDLYGGTSSALIRVLASTRDQRTKSFLFDTDTSQLISGSLDFRSYVHNLGHDYLGNLGAIEGNPDPVNPDQLVPGGKQVYRTDNDPLGRYYYEYQQFFADMAVDLPFLENGQIYAGFHDQRRTGYKQSLTIEHCAFCHVQGQARPIDEQTRFWKAGGEGSIDAVTFKYEYGRTEFRDWAAARKDDSTTTRASASAWDRTFRASPIASRHGAPIRPSRGPRSTAT